MENLTCLTASINYHSHPAPSSDSGGAAHSFLLTRKYHFVIFATLEETRCFARGCSSVGRAQPCQGWGHGFESRHPLHILVQSPEFGEFGVTVILPQDFQTPCP